MNRKLIVLSLTLVLIFCGVTLLYAWGSWAHKRIGHAAVFALPQEMMTFYYNHIDFITEGAVVPDLRRATLNDKLEPPRHFIDLESFDSTPIDSFPKTLKQARVKYDSVFLQNNGILPWYIEMLMYKLTGAFKKKNKSEIIFLSAELAHYIGDAHPPLHTSANHDGQLTDQKGIHALWESRIPELVGDQYNFNTGEAKYINDVSAEIWKMIRHSHSLLDSVLADEKKVRDLFAKDKMYKKDNDGKEVMSYGQPQFSEEYAKAYNAEMHGMVERQLRLSISDLSNFWYTAWVNGGKPDLTSMDDEALTELNKKSFSKEMKDWKKGKILNIQ